jgi:t-SNARE complex subunit (syntaxin)
MKKHLLLIMLVFINFVLADCTKIPKANSLDTALISKDYEKSKSLLDSFKLEVHFYLEKCDKSQEMFEQMNIILLTSDDKLKDLKEDMYHRNNTKQTNCSMIPSSRPIETAFKEKDNQQIEKLYIAYKKSTDMYIKNCISDDEYEIVYESAMLCEERYAQWIKEK